MFFTVPELNDIQNAYVIAVEDQARQRLEQLSALHKVKPVDLATITSPDYNHGNNNGIVETNPVYESTEIGKHNDHSGASLTSSADVVGTANPDLLLNTSGDSLIDLCQNRPSEGVSLDTTQDHSDGTTGEGEDNNMRTMNGYIEGYNPSNGPVVHTEPWNVAPAGYGNDPQPQDLSEDGETPNNNRDKNGGHREMAIDCPPTFVGSKKEPPRYPASVSTGSSSSNNNSPFRTPTGGTPVRKSANYPDTKLPESAPYTPAPKMTEEEEQLNLERIKRYQEDLRRRREEETRLEREQEFLRTSLRGSKKLQELEERQALER